MHTFDDDQGRTWQATLLEASWGNVYLVFGLLQGSEIRRKLLAAEHLAEAEIGMVNATAARLRALLAEAEPWDPGADEAPPG